MKWKAKKQPKEGDFRCRKVFAWFPTKVEEYTVWLETYEVKEFYQAIAVVGEFNDIHKELQWVETDRWTLVYMY